jgi:hypothetical protein
MKLYGSSNVPQMQMCHNHNDCKFENEKVKTWI